VGKYPLGKCVGSGGAAAPNRLFEPFPLPKQKGLVGGDKTLHVNFIKKKSFFTVIEARGGIGIV
jgi:hypothetical protein